MTATLRKQPKKTSLKEEARMMSEHVEQVIKSGEARQFMVKHGFVTKTGKLTKRYGG